MDIWPLCFAFASSLEISTYPSCSVFPCLGHLSLWLCVRALASTFFACCSSLSNVTGFSACAALPTLTRSPSLTSLPPPPPVPSGAAGRRREGPRGGPGPALRARSELGWKRPQHFKSMRGLRSGTEDETLWDPFDHWCLPQTHSIHHLTIPSIYTAKHYLPDCRRMKWQVVKIKLRF